MSASTKLSVVFCQLEAVLSNPATVQTIVQGNRTLATDPVAIGMIVFIFVMFLLPPKLNFLSICLHTRSCEMFVASNVVH